MAAVRTVACRVHASSADILEWGFGGELARLTFRPVQAREADAREQAVHPLVHKRARGPQPYRRGRVRAGLLPVLLSGWAWLQCTSKPGSFIRRGRGLETGGRSRS